jgi:hypothetical protein
MSTRPTPTDEERQRIIAEFEAKIEAIAFGDPTDEDYAAYFQEVRILQAHALPQDEEVDDEQA